MAAIHIQLDNRTNQKRFMSKYLLVYQTKRPKPQNSLELQIKSYIENTLQLYDRICIDSDRFTILKILMEEYIKTQNQKHTRSKPMRLEVTHDKGDYVFIIYDGQKNLWISFILYHFNFIPF